MSFYHLFTKALDTLQSISQQEADHLWKFNLAGVKELSPSKEQAYQTVITYFETLKSDPVVANGLSELEKNELLTQLDRVIALNAKNAESLGIHLEAKKSLIKSFKQSMVSQNFVAGGYTAFGKHQEINRRVSSPAISVSFSKSL